MSIWKRKFTVEEIMAFHEKTILKPLGIEVMEIGDDFVKGKMPVDSRTCQILGMLHGGASVVLAESLGSIGANMVIENPNSAAFGLDINANHLRPATSGFVYGTAKPIYIGSKTQVWGIEIADEKGKLVCISRLTMAVVEMKEAGLRNFGI